MIMFYIWNTKVMNESNNQILLSIKSTTWKITLILSVTSTTSLLNHWKC